MPQSVVYTMGIEFGLILITTVILSKPTFLIRMFKARFKTAATWGGAILVLATFCWSMVLGIVLTMNNLSLRI